MRPNDSELSSSVLNDIVTIAETDFFRRLDLNDAETHDSAFAVSTEYTALPTGFKGFRRSPRVNTDDYHRLKLASPSQIDDECDPTSTGTPRLYCIEANQLRLGPIPGSAITLDIVYFGTPTPITDSTDNFLLSGSPDLYLYGCLVHSAPYIGEDGRMPMWKAFYEQTLSDIEKASNRVKWAGTAGEMRVVGATP